jgi:hypothetical protein
MLYHYLSTAFRHFRQHKVTIVINVSCLALGLACFLLAWVVVESFERDRHHEKAGRTYVVTQHFVAVDGGSAGPVLPVTSLVLAESLRAGFPGIDRIVQPSTVLRYEQTEDRSQHV